MKTSFPPSSKTFWWFMYVLGIIEWLLRYFKALYCFESQSMLLMFFSLDRPVTKNQILNTKYLPTFFVVVSIQKEKFWIVGFSCRLIQWKEHKAFIFLPHVPFNFCFVFHLLPRICYLQNCDINLIRNNSNGHSMHFSELTTTYIQESAVTVRCA